MQSEPRITQQELASLFPDGVPMPLMKMIFPEKSEKLTVEDIRYILNAMRSEAALPTDAEPVTTAPDVAVKALEWRDEPVPPSGETLAPSVVGLYCIPHSGDRFYLRFRDAITLGDYSTLDKAKAAAQADYEARILSALSAQVQDGTEDPDALFWRIRIAYLRGAEWRDQTGSMELAEKASYDYADKITSPLAASPAYKHGDAE